MTTEQLYAYKEKLTELSEKEKKLRNIYLKGLVDGTLQGPPTAYSSIDRPWYQFYDEESINSSAPKLTAYEFMYENNKDHPNDIAINYFGKKMTYKQFFKKIEKTAKALRSFGVREGDIVSICSITTPEVVYLFYALNRIGAVANMIDPRMNEERIIEIVNSCNSKLMFTLDLIYPKLDKMKSKLHVDDYIVLSAYDSLGFPISNIKKKDKNYPKINLKENFSWKDFYDGSKYVKELKECEYEPNMAAGIVYTGGTTGVPKGVKLSNENFNGMAYNYSIANLEFERGQTILDIMPPFIAYGFVNGIHLPITVGVTDILIPKFDPAKFPDLILKYKPNMCLGVPSHFDILRKSEKLKNEDLSYILYPAVGGDAMNVELEKKLNEFLEEHNCKHKITKGYGMTELSGAAITSSTTVNKVASVGVPFPLNNLGIFKPGTDEELPIGEVGEICITGPTMMLGYLDNIKEEEKVKIKHSDGEYWIHSQDYGYIDKDGFLYVKGRMKRTIVRPDGHNTYPLEIENVINECEGVASSSVIDFEAKKYGNGHIPVAFIELAEGADEEIVKQAIIDNMAKKLPNRDIACNIEFIEKIPTTNIGKTDYKELERIVREKQETDQSFVEKTYKIYEKTLILK